MNSGFSIVFIIVQIISAITIICLVLLQHGKGADMGAAFGSGSAGSLFGSSGSANFLSRMTSSAAIVFFAATMALTYINAQGNIKSVSVFNDTTQDTTIAQPPVAPAQIAPIPEGVPESTTTPSVDQIPAI